MDRPDNVERGNNEENSSDKETKKSEINFKEMDSGVAKVSEVDSIDAVVDFKVLAELLIIGILLTILSSLASLIAIARFSPLQILKERG